MFARIRTVAGHTFFPRLTTHSVVVDLGANRCEFANEICQSYGCKCIAVEAVPTILPVIAADGVTIFNYAMGGIDGPIKFHQSSEPLSSSLRTIPTRAQTLEVTGRTLKTLLRENSLTRIDLLKIDIEGAEIELFDAMSDGLLQDIAQITIEFHDFCGLITSDDVARVWARLESLGFSGIRFSVSNHNCVFLRRAEFGIGALQWWLLQHVVRYARGALVRFKRFLPSA